MAMMVATTAYAARPLPEPKLIAVYAYADWCPNCKLLSPIVKQARETGGLDNKDVLFVTLDLSDKARIHQSVMLAKSLGLERFMQQQGSAVGYVALLDAKTTKELARFDRTSDSEAIVSAVNEALSR